MVPKQGQGAKAAMVKYLLSADLGNDLTLPLAGYLFRGQILSFNKLLSPF